ncbi:hypothetical protein [Nitrosophilus labii]|uniref:hypothetical protein n=1 Tax=Nitrosophilus labii TaxID=2706014 RepID=UPI001656E91F|nr:hypothetical protein [Nitrosophilus labii]
MGKKLNNMNMLKVCKYEKAFLAIPNIKNFLNKIPKNFIFPPIRSKDKIPLNSILLYIEPDELFFFQIEYLISFDSFFNKIIENKHLNLNYIKEKNIYPLLNPFLRSLDSRCNIKNAFKNINKFQYVYKISFDYLINFGLESKNLKNIIKYNKADLKNFLSKDYELFNYLLTIKFENFEFKTNYLDGFIETISNTKISGLVKCFINGEHLPQYVEIIKNGKVIDIIYANKVRNVKYKYRKYTIECGFEYIFENELTPNDQILVKVKNSNYYLRIQRLKV